MQNTFFNFDDQLWKKHWVGMPEFEQRNLEPFQTMRVHFGCPEDRDAFGELLKRRFTANTRSIWYPQEDIWRYADKRFSSEAVRNPKYPVYIVSKGRWESRLTAKALDKMKVPYRVVIEPQEHASYAAVIDEKKILTLPFSNLGQGSIPARNWIWEHASKQGAARHWILDDNIKAFYRLYRNLKTPVACGNTFAAAEDFVDRYENVAIAGFQYFMFASRKSVVPPFTLNTRIYSCILLKNDLVHRWRGRYNEDTDLSIRALKDGWCTVLFNAFLAEKTQTMTMKGGNTDELYRGDGRLQMAESLKAQHPDIVTVTRKWDRWQHHVDYGGFAKNKLKPKVDLSKLPATDNYGMHLELNEERKLLLIGQAPSQMGDAKKPLCGKIGRKLAEFAGISYEQYKKNTDRVNLFDEWTGKNGKGDLWDAAKAKEKAYNILDKLKGRRVLFVGKNVATAFGFGGLGWLVWADGPEESRVAVVPHLSGIVQWYNEPKNRKKVKEFLRSAFEDMGSGTEAA